MTKTYAEKLRDPRWQKKRLQVLQDAGFACSECGSVERTLHIHHPFYRKGVEPWDYPSNSIICLCGDCHKKHHAKKAELDRIAGRLSEKNLKLLLLLAEVLSGGPDFATADVRKTVYLACAEWMNEAGVDLLANEEDI